MPAENSPDAREHGFTFHWGQTVRFTGGTYNGFQGLVHWQGQTVCSVEIDFEGKKTEVLVEPQFLQDLGDWKRGKSETEIQLKNAT